MWCLETIVQINQEAARLAREGKPEREALRNVGITMLTDMLAEGCPRPCPLSLIPPFDGRRQQRSSS
jgi:hypothetical protein